MSLYADLGVDRSASEADIRAAYRRAAKRAHPDAGGSREDFERVSRAKLVLLDPARRDRYDRDGTADDAPSNDEAQAVAIAVQAVLAAMQAALQSGRQVESVDVVELAREGVQSDIDASSDIRGQQLGEVKKLREVAKRFRARKKKTNRLRLAFEARAAEVERAAAQQTERIRVLKMALAILDEHSFDHEAEQPPPNAVVFGRGNWYGQRF